MKHAHTHAQCSASGRTRHLHLLPPWPLPVSLCTVSTLPSLACLPAAERPPRLDISPELCRLVENLRSDKCLLINYEVENQPPTGAADHLRHPRNMLKVCSEGAGAVEVTLGCLPLPLAFA